MLDFPDMLPWDEMTALVKRHEEQFLNAHKVIAIQNEKVQEQITTLQREQAETRELVYCLEKQIDALEKVVADLTSALPQPKQVVESVQHSRFIQACGKEIPEQRLDVVEEDDCIF